jgi:hypothetical protein
MTTLTDQLEARGDPEILRQVRGPNDDSCQEPERQVSRIGLDEFVARVNNMYTRFGLSPPFGLRDAAVGWRRKGVSFTRCLISVERFLINNAAKCRSGSGDFQFDDLDYHIRGEERPSQPRRRIIKNWTPDRLSPAQWLGPAEPRPSDIDFGGAPDEGLSGDY